MALVVGLAKLTGYLLNQGVRHDYYGPDGNVFRTEYHLPSRDSSLPGLLEETGDFIASEQAKLKALRARRRVAVAS